MGLHDDLSTGKPCQPLLNDTLRRLVGQVVRASSFPPPEDFERWEEQACREVVVQMYDAKPLFVVKCWTRAHDDATLEGTFITTIRNFLIDQAKGTETGKLRRRLQGLVAKDATVTAGKLVTGEDAWWLTAGSPAPWSGDLAHLERAAGRVRGVKVPFLNPAGPTPAATVAALMSVVSAVLLAAGGAVRAQDVTQIVEHRFGLSSQPVTRPLLGANDAMARVVTRGGAGADVEVLVEDEAQQVWATLDEAERTVCCNFGVPSSDLQVLLGRGARQTDTIKDRLTAKMRKGCADSVDVEAVIARVMQLCRERP